MPFVYPGQYLIGESDNRTGHSKTLCLHI